jgi:glycosyltransferase involved in cell wall biosynthesis
MAKSPEISTIAHSGASVSIVLCTYNGARFLEKQIQSIFDQDYTSISEIICVDDCSTDQTWDILLRYSNENPKVKPVRNEVNLGYNGNFQKALLLASSDLIAIADHDDIWLPSKISHLVANIDSSLMVYSDDELIDENDEPLGTKTSDKRRLGAIDSCINFAPFNVISGHTMLLRKELLEKSVPFPQHIPYDYWLAFRATQFTEIKYVDKQLVKFRIHQTNATLGKKRQSKSEGLNYNSIRLAIFATNIEPNLVAERTFYHSYAQLYGQSSLGSRWKLFVLLMHFGSKLQRFKKKNILAKSLFPFKAFAKFV